MNRKQFVKSLAILPFLGYIMKLNSISKLVSPFTSSEKMPMLFLGHGSPMNAIEENEFVQGFRAIAKTIPTPQAILCISAHWETKGTYVTAMTQPKTIHDFGGFPKELFEVQYPAPGSPDLAKLTKETIHKTTIGLDESWGLDHGAWSVVKHLYPLANIPIIQMSLDYSQAPQYHYELAKEISELRKKGILIVGSGNIVHNLGMISWEKLNDPFAYDWAIEVNDKIKNWVSNNEHKPMIDYKNQGNSFQLAIPTPDHYLPLLYILGLKEENEKIEFFNDKPMAGSLTMTSVKVG